MWVGKQTPSKGHFSIGGQPSRSDSGTSPCTHSGQTGVGAFANEITLKLGQCSHQMKDELRTGRPFSTKWHLQAYSTGQTLVAVLASCPISLAFS
jgi:hypothetical protein